MQVIKTNPCNNLPQPGCKRLKISPLPTKDADLPTFLEECCPSDEMIPKKSEKSDDECISSVKVCSANSSHSEKIRHRPLSASSHDPKFDPPKCNYVVSSKPTCVDAIRSRPSSATNSNVIPDVTCNDKENPGLPCIDPISSRPALASNPNHSKTRRYSENVFLGVHNIPQALTTYRLKTVLIGLHVSTINDENVDPTPADKTERRSSIRWNSLRDRLRKSSSFDTHLVLKQEMRMLEKKRMRQKLSRRFTIDDAIVAEKVKYRRCVQKLETFFNRMTEFNTDDGSSAIS